MINIKAKRHDKFSVEFKVGYSVDSTEGESTFAVNTWFFVPNSLDVNPQTYGKKQFYRDVKSNIRLITSHYPLGTLVDESSLPFTNLRTAFEGISSGSVNQQSYEYHIKMFAAIVRKSIDNALYQASHAKDEVRCLMLCEECAANLKHLYTNFRQLGTLLDNLDPKLRNYYLFADEFLLHMVSLNTIRLISILRRSYPQKTEESVAKLVTFARSIEREQKECGYHVVNKNDPQSNRDLVFHYGLLKKYAESDLYIHLNKKQDGFAIQQIYYSIAAGLAMVFATVVAFSFQRIYGAFSMPLFVALVVSYMLKDRIKELIRYYFAYKLREKYFDNKAYIRIRENTVGTIKEGADFIAERHVPAEVMELRNRSAVLEAENRIFDEKILLYRKLVTIDNELLATKSDYPTAGINDIMRLHVTRFTQKMDDSQTPLRYLDARGDVATVYSSKVYYLNAIMQLKSDNQTTFQRFRIVMSHDGIVEIQEFN